MRTPKINTKKLAAALAPIALAGAMIAPTAAASTPPVAHGTGAANHVRAGSGAGHLFTIHNNSMYEITLTGLSGDSPWADPPPALHTVVPPGGAIGFEVGWSAWHNTTGTASFESSRGKFDVHMSMSGGLGVPSSTCDPGPHPFLLACSEHGEGWDQGTIRVWDGIPVHDDIGSDRPQAQADVIHRLCDNQTDASCQFTPTKEEHTKGAERPATASTGGYEVANETKDPMHVGLEWSDKVDTTNGYEVGGDITANLFHIIDLGVDGKYHHEVTSSHEFKMTLDFEVEPGDKGWATDQPAIIREWGDMTVRMQNATWNLTNVHFDTPDATGQGLFTSHTGPINSKPAHGGTF
jgi:hypothetical protein